MPALTGVPTACQISNEPQYHFKDGHCIFIIENDRNFIPLRIKQYNLDKQAITKTYQAPQLEFGITSASIDRENEIIYMLGGDECIFMSVDLKNNEWNILKNDKINKRLNKSLFFSNSHFIPSPINQLHITCNEHFKFDKEQNKLIKLNDNVTSCLTRWDQEDENVERSPHQKFIYCKSSSQLMMFQTMCRVILVCDVSQDRVSDWKRYRARLPDVAMMFEEFDVILVWDQIVFWFDFYYEKEEGGWNIYCLDLKHNDKWYKSRGEIPEFRSDVKPYVIKDDDNNVHLISFWYGDNQHSKASLFDLLPSEIVQLNRKMYDPLIVGFVKQYEKKHKSIFIPSYLKKLIVQFYPLFV